MLTERRVLVNELPSIGPLFQFQNLVPFLTSIGDWKYYPHLVAQFYANLSSSKYACELYLLRVEMSFDDVLLGHILKVPSTGIDLSLSFEELRWNYQDVNKSISQNKRSAFKPNRLNQLNKQSRLIAYILVANVVQKKGHHDELSDLCCNAIYAITNRISVNWAKLLIHNMTYIKPKFFYRPCLTYLFEHFDVPLSNQPDLAVKAKPLGATVVAKMELAFERAKALKNVRLSSSQASEESSSEESEEDSVSREQVESLQKQIKSVSTRLDEYHIESSRRSTEIERKMDDLMSYLRGRFPPNE